jgi:hypothetical protein
MSTWRCGWICPRSYFFAAVFLAGRVFRGLVGGGILGGRLSRPPIAAPYLWEDDEVDGGAVETLPHAEEADHVRTQYHHPGAALVH